MINISNNKNNHFIFAAPRSGTTWLSKMLNAHINIKCVERRLFGNYSDFVQDTGQMQPRLRVTLDKYVNSLMLHYGLPQSERRTLTKAFINAMQKTEFCKSNIKIIVDKVTPYLDTASIVLEQIDYYFPKSKIIYLVRDGRDVLTSGVFHWFNKQHVNTSLSTFELDRRKLFMDNPNLKTERFFQDEEIKQWSLHWKQSLQTIEKAKQHHEIMIVSYESMLKETHQIVAECLSFLSVKTSKILIDACVSAGSFNNMSNGRESGEVKVDAHIRKGVIGDWRNYFTKKDGEMFHEIAGKELINFGYERNNNWFEKIKKDTFQD